jgi:hypothetical protein
MADVAGELADSVGLGEGRAAWAANRVVEQAELLEHSEGMITQWEKGVKWASGLVDFDFHAKLHYTECVSDRAPE